MNSLRIVRTLFLCGALAGAALSAGRPEVTVYKTRTCGCCGKWVQHLRDNGFTVKVNEVENTEAAQKQNGVPENLRSCHTAVVGGYTLEGHVPAADVQKLLKTHPKAKGLAVPGMPAGSPGMESGRRDAYSVVLFDASGKTSEFHKYPGD